MDILLFVDPGLEFPQMYEHIDKLEQYLQFPITRLKPPHTFEYLFYEYVPRRKNPALEGVPGLSWPGPQCRWCTARLKPRIIDRYLRELKKEFEVVQYIGIAADEQERVREFRYPLVEWKMAEADCLAYCKARGFRLGRAVRPVPARIMLVLSAAATLRTAYPAKALPGAMGKTAVYGRAYMAAVPR